MELKPPHVNRWFSDTVSDRRVISEKSARKIELASGKPERWLDQMEQPESVAELSAIYNSLDDNLKRLMLEQMRVFLKFKKPG